MWYVETSEGLGLKGSGPWVWGSSEGPLESAVVRGCYCQGGG